RNPATQAAILLGRTVFCLCYVVAILFIVDNAVRRLRSPFLPHDLHKFRALFAQYPLHAANGVALAVQQMPNSAQEIDVVGAIVTPASATLHRFDFVEAAFPQA